MRFCLLRQVFTSQRWPQRHIWRHVPIYCAENEDSEVFQGWLGGAMVLGKLPVLGRPTIRITVGQGPTALAVGAGGGCLEIFTLIYPFFLPLFGRRLDID